MRDFKRGSKPNPGGATDMHSQLLLPHYASQLLDYISTRLHKFNYYLQQTIWSMVLIILPIYVDTLICCKNSACPRLIFSAIILPKEINVNYYLAQGL